MQNALNDTAFANEREMSAERHVDMLMQRLDNPGPITLRSDLLELFREAWNMGFGRGRSLGISEAYRSGGE